MADKKVFDKLMIEEEATRCLLCYDPPCSKACPGEKDPAGVIMSIRFKNYKGASNKVLEDFNKSQECGVACDNKMYCQRSCIRNKIDRPIKIRIIQDLLCKEKLSDMEVKGNE
ncbi:hypothetical protein [Clostridium sp. DJ247]|uniref:hypothetical protein n=1 Tax=Clostridium sp. DJ247 TaxID=2726188 RepID=UPI001624DEA2|nr:hypothetical protein [Clostridium sp. DJ247]MBC2582370.1 hypothetical protein [Clostridium sp. DJ247]